MWYVVTSADVISTGPKPWNRDSLSDDLVALNVNVRVPLLEPVTPLNITDPSTSASAYVLPQNRVEPATLNEWEELIEPPVEAVVSGVEVTATYSKQDKTKSAVFDDKKTETLDKRDLVLISGWEASTGNVFETRYYDLIKFAVTHSCLNGSLISEVGGDLDDLKAWKTDGTSKPMDTEAKITGGMTKLYEWFRGIEHTTAGHLKNLEILRDDLADAWELGYLGPGHGTPYDAEDVCTYDVTTGWPT